MKKQAWVAKTVESSLAQLLIFFFLFLLTGSFTFLAFRARADLAAPDVQVTPVQEAEAIPMASSMNDLYDKSWLADERNFVELAGYADKLVRLPTSQPLEPVFKQQLSDYVQKNQARLPKESRQLEKLSFPEGILRQDQSRLLEMYDQLSLVFHTMEDFVLYWDQEPPRERVVAISTLDEVFSTAVIQFQTTTADHRKIPGYIRQLGERSQQARAAELDRIRNRRTQLMLAIGGLVASGLGLAGWMVWWRRMKSRKWKVESRK